MDLAKRMGAFVRHKARIGLLSVRHFFITYCIAFMIPLLLIVLFVQANYISRLQNSYQEMLNGYARELKENLDITFKRMEDVVHSLVFDDAIEDRYTPDKPVDVMHLATKLRECCQGIPMLHEVIVYGEQDAYLFSNVTSYSLDNFAAFKHIEGWADTIDFRAYLLGADTWQTLRGNYNGKRQFLVIYPWKNPSMPTRVLIFVLNEDMLQEMMRRALKGHIGSVRMLDAAGNVLIAVGESKSDVLVSAVRAGIGPYTYELHIQSGTIVDGLAMLRSIWYLILALTVGLGFFGALVLSRSSIKPIRTLRRKLGDDDDLPGDDYEALCQSIENVHAEFLSLQKCSQAAQSHFVEKLLCNEADTGSVLRILVNVYNLPLAVEAWQVVIIAPALAARSDDLRAKLREVLPDGVTPLLRDCRSDGRLALILAYEKGRYDGKSAITDLLSICAGIGRFGLSQRFEDVEELPLAYAQAAIALNDGGDKFLFTPTDAPQSAEIVALEKAIEKSDPEKLLECLNAYLLTLQEDTSNAAAHKLHAMHALLLCQRRLSAMGKNRSSIRLDAVLDGLHMPLRAWASLWSAEIVAFVRQLTQDREDALPTSQIACMCAYLQNQCLDTDFTVQKMAEHFDITLPALNAFFKSATGMTVAQYFSNLKMELAKTLLKTTDISIYEIGLKLGYYGPSSFIRRFKQVTEMTPGEYRDTCALHEVD